MNNISLRIVDWLIQTDAIESSQRSIYEMGIRQVITYIVNIISTIILGILFESVLPAVIISLFFMLLQRYSGSYHAPHRWICYVGSMMMIAGDLYLFSTIELTFNEQCFLMCIFIILICTLAPVESKNKKLDEIEKIVYKSRCRKICVIYGALWFVSFSCGILALSKIILFVLFDISILQLLGKIVFCHQL